MKKSTKGALAAAAAGTLLLGGAGSLAFWTSSQTVDGTDIASGHLKLTDPACDGWELDGGTPYTDQLLVPGDTLTQHCDFDVQAAGAHLTADFDVDEGTELTGDAALTDELDPTASYTVNGSAVGDTDVAVVDGDTVGVDISIEWDYGVEDNDSNVVGGLSAALDEITVTATQHHTP